MRCIPFVLAAFLLGTSPTFAEYPERPVRIFVGGAAGGTLDTVVRTLKDAFEQKFGQALIIENRPGAFGILTANAVMEAEPDGYTLGTITPGALDALKEKKYDPGRLNFISGLATFPMIIVVKKDGPRSIRELIEKAPKEYGYFNTIGQIAGETFLDAAGIVPRPQGIYYTGREPAMLTNLLGGQIAYAVVTASAARGLLGAGNLAALAVAAKRRSPFLLTVPTLTEALSEAGKTGLKNIREPALGLVGPQGMPSDVTEKLEKGLREILAQSDIQEAFSQHWIAPTSWTRHYFEEYIRTK